jgi:uncharacterized membrane protein
LTVPVVLLHIAGVTRFAKVLTHVADGFARRLGTVSIRIQHKTDLPDAAVVAVADGYLEACRLIEAGWNVSCQHDADAEAQRSQKLR